jgi:hypothetical protein
VVIYVSTIDGLHRVTMTDTLDDETDSEAKFAVLMLVLSLIFLAAILRDARN